MPKFCDNIIAFEAQKEAYLTAYDFLEKAGRILQDKDGNDLYPIAENIFVISYFNKCLSRSKIENYNNIIGNANYLINLYNQAHKKENGFKKISLFKTLYKQIGCGKRNALFFTLNYERKNDYEKKDECDIQSVEEVLKMAENAGKKYFCGKNNSEKIEKIDDFIDYVKNRENYSGIYWSKAALNTISNKYFADWHTLKDKFKEAKIFAKGKKGDEEDIKIPEAIELEGLFSVLDASIKEIEDRNNNLTWKSEGLFFKESLTKESKNFEENKKNKKRKGLIERSNKPSQALIGMIFNDMQECAEKFINFSDEILKIQKYSEKENKEKIKSWMDNALAVNRIFKYFLVKESKARGEPIDPVISAGLDVFLRSDDTQWFKWYDALRNYLTKKPQDDAKNNKLKLNFECPYLLNGWSSEYGTYDSVIIEKGKKKYLAIINGTGLSIEQKNKIESIISEYNYARRHVIITQKIDNKNPPRWFIRSKGENFAPLVREGKLKLPDEILNIYDKELYSKTKNKNGYKPYLIKLIDYFKRGFSIHPDFVDFVFSSWEKSNKYDSIADFYNHTASMCYKTEWKNINFDELLSLTNKGKIYLFEIKNQDFNDGKKDGHKNNLHTIYWQAVFQDIKNRPKLNGGAEIFYRKAVPVEKIEKIKDKKGKDVIKNFRFSKEKFLFHVPITLNFCLKNEKVNNIINEKISQNSNACFLGIDRGEKHLAYYSLINQKGEIMVQNTLNTPFLNKDGKQRIIKAEKRSIDNDGIEKLEMVDCKDYNDLLDARAGNRNYARKNWQTIGTIKELKNGYISQVVRKIVDIAVDKTRETPSFIVLENLNVGFKRGRQKIEKQVYQKLELALAKKLNFLVDKKAKNGEIGSARNALQFTPPVNNFGDMENKKQFGIMLYVKVNYTSQTDPITGWRKTIYLKKGSEKYVKDQIVNMFDDIGFDGKDFYFDYTVDYLNPINKKSDKKYQKHWRLYSSKNGKSLDRFRSEKDNNKNQWVSSPQNVLKILKGVFEGFDLSRSLLAQIKDGKNPKKIDSKYTGWESLRFAIDLIQQIRNSGIEKKDDDFILSPVSENGSHFDSRNAKENQPSCGDANGAYNIARKGIIMNEHIRLGLSPFIQDDEWDAWLAGRDIWNAWIENNKDNLRLKKS